MSLGLEFLCEVYSDMIQSLTTFLPSQETDFNEYLLNKSKIVYFHLCIHKKRNKPLLNSVHQRILKNDQDSLWWGLRSGWFILMSYLFKKILKTNLLRAMSMLN